MRKIDLRKEKALRNEEYAKRFKKYDKPTTESGSKYLNWCRVKGHPASCAVRECPQI